MAHFKPNTFPKTPYNKIMKNILLFAFAACLLAGCKDHDENVPVFHVKGRMKTDTGNPAYSRKLKLYLGSDNSYIPEEGRFIDTCTTDANGYFDFEYKQLSKSTIGDADYLRVGDYAEIPYAEGLAGIPLNSNFTHDAFYKGGYGWVELKLNNKKGIATALDTLFIGLPKILSGPNYVPNQLLIIPLKNAQPAYKYKVSWWTAKVHGQKETLDYYLNWAQLSLPAQQRQELNQVVGYKVTGDPDINVVNIDY